MAKAGGGHAQASIAGMVIIRIALGAFFLYDGISNLMLPKRFIGYLSGASSAHGAFMSWSVGPQYDSFLLKTVHPHAELFAWVIMILSTLVGALLLVGLLTRLAAFLSLPISVFFLLALWAAPRPNFYFYTALVVAGLAVLIAAAGRTFGFDALLTTKTKSRILW